MTDTVDYVAAARWDKANRLARTLAGVGADANTALFLPPLGWHRAERLARVRPSSETTRSVVVYLLEGMDLTNG